MKNNKLKLIGSILFFSIFVISCSNDEWTKEEQGLLIERCRLEGGEKSYCKCYLKNAMEKFPNANDMNDIDFESAFELSIGCE